MATIVPIVNLILYAVGDCNFPLSDLRAAKLINEFGASKVGLSVVEDVVKVTEKAARRPAKKILEPVAFREKTARNVEANMRRMLTFTESFKRTARFSLMRQEMVSFVEKSSKKADKQFLDFLAVDGAVAKEAGLNAKEVLAAEDFLGKTAVFFLALAESIAVIPKTNRDTGVNHCEMFAISPAGRRAVEALKKEGVLVAGSFFKRSVFKREFAEKICGSSRAAKEYRLSQKEFLEIAESYIRRANAALSDIYLGAGEMTLEEFLDKVSSPPGYDRFIDFNVGEYEYKNALVRMVIEAGAAKAEPLIYDMAVNVDIDDTVDRGTAQITDTTGPTAIKFNKHYYHPPEVGIAVKGGSGTDITTVEIVKIQKDGFDVSLYNSGRVRVAGVVTWTAIGY